MPGDLPASLLPSRSPYGPRRSEAPVIASPHVSARMIPVARPLMPGSTRLMPYLQQIDQSRVYSNFGPLVRSLEARLAAHFAMPIGSVLTVANATLGLTLALQALGAPKGSLCLLPSWTFAASAHAAVMAGLRPYFFDVDPETWALLPDMALHALESRTNRQIGAVMPVAPFGHPIDIAAWDRFAERTRVAVVIDAAAGFDALRPGITPAVVSLHATKVLGAGEGGFVVTRDKHIIAEIQRRSNFGFSGAREARVISTNAKMSEYSAAIGLASLDAWDETRARFHAVARAYRAGMAGVPGVELQSGYGTDWVSTTCIAKFTNPGLPSVDTIAGKLAAQGVDTRRWWPRVLPEETAFERFGHDRTPVGIELSDRTLGLPCFVDLADDQVACITAAIAAAIGAPAVRAGQSGRRRQQHLAAEMAS